MVVNLNMIEMDVAAAPRPLFHQRGPKGARVVPELGEVAIFTVQDVLADAPFSRLRLVCCRNLLIYLPPRDQEKVLLLFHFARRRI
jgi:two-component system CheB/CheR fusion protein